MKDGPRYLVIPDEGQKDISALLSLDANQMRMIIQTLGKKETLKTTKSSYERVAEAANLSHEVALNVLSAITNLIHQRQRYELSDEQLLDDLQAGWPKETKKLDEDAKKTLLSILSESEEGYLVQKVQNLRVGFATRLVSVRSICDVRPVFDRNREVIQGALLIASLGITTHDENHRDQTFVLQLTRSDLAKLRQCLEETERKLKVMEENFGEMGLELLS